MLLQPVNDRISQLFGGHVITHRVQRRIGESCIPNSLSKRFDSETFNDRFHLVDTICIYLAQARVIPTIRFVLKDTEVVKIIKSVRSTHNIGKESIRVKTSSSNACIAEYCCNGLSTDTRVASSILRTQQRGKRNTSVCTVSERRFVASRVVGKPIKYRHRISLVPVLG